MKKLSKAIEDTFGDDDCSKEINRKNDSSNKFVSFVEKDKLLFFFV